MSAVSDERLVCDLCQSSSFSHRHSYLGRRSVLLCQGCNTTLLALHELLVNRIHAETLGRLRLTDPKNDRSRETFYVAITSHLMEVLLLAIIEFETRGVLPHVDPQGSLALTKRTQFTARFDTGQ